MEHSPGADPPELTPANSNRRKRSWPFRRFLIAVSGSHAPVPHPLTGQEALRSVFVILAAEILVLILWFSGRFLGMDPTGRPSFAFLAWVVVLVAGMGIFGLRQSLRGQRGIGWQGALVSGVAAATASLIVAALTSPR